MMALMAAALMALMAAALMALMAAALWRGCGGVDGVEAAALMAWRRRR